MNTPLTFTHLKSILIRQGIVTGSGIRPETDFRKDLNYKPGDLLELALLIEQEFRIQLSKEQISSLTTVQELAGLLNSLHTEAPAGRIVQLVNS